MASIPLEERPIADFESYDLVKKVTVNKYNESYYVEHEGLQIEFLKELEDAKGSLSEREEEPIHEVEEAIPQKPEGPYEIADPSGPLQNLLASSSGIYDDIVTIHYSQPFPSPRLVLKI